MSADNPTLTSANSIFTIVVPGLYNTPVKLEGYAADKAWDFNPVTLAVTVIGVDGKKSAGYTPALVPQSIALQGDSKSRRVFKDIIQATIQNKETYRIDGTIVLPSTGESVTLTNGTLTEAPMAQSAHNVLQQVEYTITWETVLPTLT